MENFGAIKILLVIFLVIKIIAAVNIDNLVQMANIYYQEP